MSEAKGMIKSRNKKIIITTIAIILLFIAKLVLHMYQPISVEYNKMARVNIEKTLIGSKFTVITDAKNPLIKEYNIPISTVDFDKNYLLISFGREISQITYTRASKYFTPYKGTYLGLEIYKKQFYQHSIFVYKIKKIYLINEEQAELPYTIRIEK